MHTVHSVRRRREGSLALAERFPEAIVLSFRVAREHAGQRLDHFIRGRIPRLSRTRAQEIVRACAYRADGTLRRPSERVKPLETVYLVRPRFEEPDTPVHFDVVYEDEHVLAVDKPPGLPMHPTATYHRNTLTYLLREKYGDPAPHIAHRLDRETSGIVLCGRSLDAERNLKRAFEHRRVQKTYLAIVRGELPQERGEISLPMARVTQGLHVCMEIRAEGEGLPAVSHYEVRERRAGYTLVALWPKTGRQHQLRLHLAAIGYPVVGDKLYGPEGTAPFLEYIETGMTDALAARVGHWRHALHAYEISLTHPMTGTSLDVRAELPADLVALWNELR